MGINIAQLLVDAEAMRQELLRLGPEWRGDFDQRLFPFIQFTAQATIPATRDN
jgi:hypothetical protein